MPTAAFEDSASISTTEYSLPNDSTSLSARTDDGIYQLFLDLSALAQGDQYQLKIYEKILSGGSQKVLYQPIFDGPIGDDAVVFPALILMHGWDITLKKLAGTDRTIGWSIRSAA